MKKYELLKQIVDEKVMAIIRVESFERAREIVDGCLSGGVRCLEISYTNFNASDIIKQLDQYYGDKIIIGAGTVLDSETARLAMISGAKFIISPTSFFQVNNVGMINIYNKVLEIANNGNNSIYKELSNLEDEDFQSVLSEIMFSEYEISSVDKFVEEIINNYEKNKLISRKQEILKEIKIENISKEETSKLENELNEIITKLAKIR